MILISYSIHTLHVALRGVKFVSENGEDAKGAATTEWGTIMSDVTEGAIGNFEIV